GRSRRVLQCRHVLEFAASSCPCVSSRILSIPRVCATAVTRRAPSRRTESPCGLRVRLWRIRSHFLQARENLTGDFHLLVCCDPVPRDAERQTVCPPSPASDA